MLRNLYLAYAATWIIHFGYWIHLGRRYARLKRERAELGK